MTGDWLGSGDVRYDWPGAGAVSRTPTPNDFAVLGLRPGAGDDEIRDAYRRLAKVHHPDRNPGDQQALETFRRLTDSYAALRGGAPNRSRGQRTAASAAAGGRRRTSPRRGTAAATMTVADIPVGGALWVTPTAVLVGPDRAATLRPAALGTAYPTADTAIRVERRGDGHHVFMPPQPLARWPVAVAADSEGLAVAALWVGDRQDGEAGSASAARVPLRLMSGTIGEMAVDERGWVACEALAVDDDGTWTLDPAQPVSPEPHRTTPVRVLRDEDGFRVHGEMPASDWQRGGHGEAAGRLPVLTAILAGASYPPPANRG